MSTEYKQILPAQDWFFCHEGPKADGSATLYPIAVWAVRDVPSESGETQTEVIGLIAPNFGGSGPENRMLHTPPPIAGCYLHRDQLTESELESIRKR